MRIIRRTFANLNKSTLFLGKAGENLVTRLEIDVSKELSEYTNPSFDLILSMPSDNEPYPVLATLSGSKLIYNFTENDLSKAGNGQIEALVAGASGEVLKSTTAKTVIEPSINPNTYPGPIQKVIDDIKEEIGELDKDFKIATTISDLETVPDGGIVLVPNTISEGGVTINAGIIQKAEVGFDSVTSFVSPTEKLSYEDAVNKKHWHENKPYLDKIGETNEEETSARNMTYNGHELATQSNLEDAVSDLEDEIAALSTPDTLVALSLGETYDELFVRPDWQDVPVYITGSNPVVCYLASDTIIDGFAQSEIRLMYLVDYQTGMPCPALAVTSGGNYLTYFPVTYHAIGKTMAAGWYDANDDPVSGTPTFTNMTFDSLAIGSGEPITDLTGLSGEALCALETLSRMVNVSVDAMGTLGVKPDGVQRMKNEMIVDRAQRFVTSNNFTISLPSIPSWVEKDLEMVLYLDCNSDIDVTFPVGTEFVGEAPNTKIGTHKLIFIWFRHSAVWSVGCIDSEATS